MVHAVQGVEHFFIHAPNAFSRIGANASTTSEGVFLDHGGDQALQSFMDVKGMPGAFKACKRLVVPVRGNETTNRGFSIFCRLNRGYKTQSNAKATLLTTIINVNSGNMTQTWRTLSRQRQARVLGALPHKKTKNEISHAGTEVRQWSSRQRCQ